MDKLKGMFENQRLDAPTIAEGHEHRFKQKLAKALPERYKRKLALTITAYGAAASVGLFLFLSVLKTEHTIKHHATVPSHQSEIVETEMYYEGLINERIRKIEQLNPHAEQISEILKDLSEFDNSLVNMKKDLEQAPGDERIIGAVMNTYRMKLEVLDNIVEIFQKKS